MTAQAMLLELLAVASILQARYPYEPWPDSDPLTTRFRRLWYRLVLVIALGLQEPGLSQVCVVRDQPEVKHAV